MSTDNMTPEGESVDLATVGSLWLHKKSGGVYRVVGRCTIEATLTQAIAYRSESASDATIWIRPANEFMDGRFTIAEEAPASRSLGSITPPRWHKDIDAMFPGGPE